MLPISELVHVGESCDDRWRSPLGDAAAAAFGIQGAVFLRSSQNHVFRSDSAVVRIQSSAHGDPTRMAATAEWGERLHQAGANVAGPLRSRNGRLVESVEWGGFSWYASAWEFVEGSTFESEDVPVEQAMEWGGALAQFHEHASALAPAASPADGRTDSHPGLGRAGGSVGMLHGDPELSWLPALARRQSAELLTRLLAVLAEPVSSDWPEWAQELAQKVRGRAAAHRRAVSDVGRSWP